MGRWRNSTQALAQRPPTPPVELWDCEIEEIEAAKAKSGTPPAPTSTPTTEAEEEEEEEAENWDTASEEELSWDHIGTETPPTDYSNELSPEEEEEGLAAGEASLPTKETDEGIWFRSSSPFWRVREEWKRASYAQRADMDKYYLVDGPDLDLTTGNSPPFEHRSKGERKSYESKKYRKRKIIFFAYMYITLFYVTLHLLNYLHYIQ